MSIVKRGAAVILLVSQVACHSFRRVESPGAYLESRSPQTIMVTRADGSATIIQQPRVLADTVFGWTQTGTEITLPLSTVTELRARQINPFRTALFSVALGAVTLALATAVIGQGPETPEDPPEDIFVPVFRIRF
jgi:hypothetical protein